MSGPLLDVGFLATGVASGALSAAFGVGGAALSTPAIRALGVAPLLAVGTTLPSVIPSAVVGTLRYSRAGLVDWAAVVRIVPSGTVAAVAGSLLSHALPGGGHWLMVLTALVLGWMALRLATPRPARPTAPGDTLVRSRISSPAVAATASGVGAGLLSGLLGLGGGVVLVPALTELLGMTLHRAVATSLACVGLLAVPSTITHGLVGDIDWTVALLLTVGVVPGARIGSALALRASERRLRTVVAAFLGLVAVVYGAGELAALLP
ncbi:hypothetical protein EV189_0948 [Motilibacter rhizosphaerae]|uniref:Probable membrane transporter protein n=1 Tax=Motilibacter rhizosphaerae TaxID=598652 RepID=A0A4Q7NWM0_9ACTN|nr:sulfite exporter TauE/SafE family protein [Motilibacter rhizosphaerae]RZS91701.1 hypothetical protein EV189_0948 [Motilibacter rhizosphaerae]